MNQPPSHLQHQQQQPPPPIHQQPPQHHYNNNNNNGNHSNNNQASLHSSHQPSHQSHQPPQGAAMSDVGNIRSKDLNSWCEAFDKHELVDILVKISGTNSQFQSYLGHAFVTDIKWCKIRVTFTSPSSPMNPSPNSTQIQNHFMQYGNIKQIECFPTINAALITYDNYTYAQSAVSVGIHENVGNTGYNAQCCYEFEGNEPSMHQHSSISGASGGGGNSMVSGPLEQRRIFVSSLSYSTQDDTLENVFSQYGELEDCTIVKDKLTGRSKGYGFVVFKSVSGAVNALKTSEKFIDGRRTRSWLAAQGNQMRNQNR